MERKFRAALILIPILVLQIKILYKTGIYINDNVFQFRESVDKPTYETLY